MTVLTIRVLGSAPNAKRLMKLTTGALAMISPGLVWRVDMLSHNYLLRIVLLAFLFFCGCDRKESESPLLQSGGLSKVEAKTLTEEIVLNTIQALWVDEDYFIVTGYDRVSDCYVHVFDRQSGSAVGHIVHKGRGPDELVSLTSSWYADGILFLYSATGMRSCSLNFKQWKSDGVYLLEDNYPEIDDFGDILIGTPTHSLALWNRSFLDDPIKSHERIRVLDCDSGAVVASDCYPLDDRLKTWVMYNQPVYAVSPDFHHLILASAYHTGCTMELYEIDSNIDLVKSECLINPDFKTDGNRFEPEDRLVAGVSSCSASDSLFVVSFDGVTRIRDIFDGNKSPWFNRLIWFDWKFRPVRQALVDYSIACLCMSGDTVYAIGQNQDSEMFILQL